MCLTQAVRCEPASAFTGEGLRSSGSWGLNAGRREQRWQMAEQPMIARQLPDRGEIFLDHLAHFVPSLDCAAAVLEKLGCRLTPFAAQRNRTPDGNEDRKSTRLNPSHTCATRMPSSARKKKDTNN